MGSRRFEITIVSAENLPDIRRLGRMKVYAEVSLNGEYETKKATTVDREGDTNPRWNFPFVYNVHGSYLRRPGLDVVVDLYCQRTLGDKFVGQVIIPINTLFQKGLKSQRSLSYPIAGTRKGRLNILYCFEEMFKITTAPWEEDGDDQFQLTEARLALIADFSSFIN
ncbi:hypothetical protein C2S51_008009 [Perilla frutescens var. frutescens]|nr:hypothetical protein C2S51_008009 [Perilla frutescens var. frutescens]